MLNLRGLKILVLTEIQSNVVSVESKEVIGPFPGRAESKAVRLARGSRGCGKLAQMELNAS